MVYLGVAIARRPRGPRVPRAVHIDSDSQGRSGGAVTEDVGGLDAVDISGALGHVSVHVGECRRVNGGDSGERR